jgi:hypothetical protein
MIFVAPLALTQPFPFLSRALLCRADADTGKCLLPVSPLGRNFRTSFWLPAIVMPVIPYYRTSLFHYALMNSLPEHWASVTKFWKTTSQKVRNTFVMVWKSYREISCTCLNPARRCLPVYLQSLTDSRPTVTHKQFRFTFFNYSRSNLLIFTLYILYIFGLYFYFHIWLFCLYYVILEGPCLIKRL